MVSYPTSLRIFTIFLNEGVRVFYKIMYGFLIILKPKLLSEKNQKNIPDIFIKS